MAQTMIVWENTGVMLQTVFKKLVTKKYMLAMLGYFIFFMALYTVLDYLNIAYPEMARTYGAYLVVVNVLINAVMAALSSFLIGATTAQFDFSKKQSKGANMSFVSVIFGIFTYGCTPCVISFLAAIGISFSVAVLPLAGLPYKFISLFLLLGGLVWILLAINKTVCQVNDTKDDPTIILK